MRRDEGFFAVQIEQRSQFSDFSESCIFQYAGVADSQQRFCWLAWRDKHVPHVNSAQFLDESHWTE
jgi:hypothetical protein